jgi:RNA polymerase sigma factor (sigma-70 family)
MEAGRQPASLDAQQAGEMPPLGARLAGSDPAGEWDRLVLRDLLRHLPPRERRVIVLRYLCDQSQAQVAAAIGVSQVHISRIERQALRMMREAGQ